MGKLLKGTLLVILLANAASLVAFRYFTSVDGPMHVLRAHVGHVAPGPAHQAHGCQYGKPRQPFRLGHACIRATLRVAGPEMAHDLAAVLAGWAVLIAAIAYLRAHGVRMGLAILWLAPIGLNSLLIMGLFHFLLAVAVALATVAWWRWHAHAPRTRAVGMLMGIALAIFVHRGGPILLAMVFLPEFLFTHRNAPRSTRTLGRILLLIGAFTVLAVFAAWSMGVSWLIAPSETPVAGSDFLLRPLLLLDRRAELGLVHGLGVLLLVAVAAGAFGRWRMGRRLQWHDVLALLVLAFALIGWLGNSPYGRRFILSDRGQWLALLALVMWLAAMAHAADGRIRRIIAATALLAVPLQTLRLVQAEASLADLLPMQLAFRQASDALEPNSLVLPVLSGSDRLMQHQLAYLILQHSGIVIAPKEQLDLKRPDPWDGRGPWERFGRDPYWVLRHWRAGLPPEVDHVLFLGNDPEWSAQQHPWPSLLQRYTLTFSNTHTRLYTVAQP